MKFTLAFCVHNTEHLLPGVLNSWTGHSSGENDLEVIVVCDACQDHSAQEATWILNEAKTNGWITGYQVIETPDIYEIQANNAALALAAPDSDYILFIQDDNWVFDPSWDLIALKTLALVERPGALAFLAGGVFNPDATTYQRVETNRLHKGQYFINTQVPADKYPPGVYAVDFVTRPFMISTPLLRSYGGLGGPEFDLLCWDDTDLCLKLQRDGYTNLYLSLDVLNIVTSSGTMPDRMRKSFEHNRDLVMPKFRNWLQWREGSPFAKLADLTVESMGVRLADPVYDV